MMRRIEVYAILINIIILYMAACIYREYTFKVKHMLMHHN